MSDILYIKKKCVDEYFNYSISFEERAERISNLLSTLERPLKQKTLFDIFIKPLKFISSENVRKHLIEHYALAMHFFTENDFDYVCAVMGMEGIGKSTFALNLGMLLSSIGDRRNFGMDDIIFAKDNHEKVVEKILNKTNSVIMFDEARPFFDLRSSMSPERLEKLEIITTERWRRNIYILCISDISELDKYFRERRIRTLFVIPDRKIFFALQNKSFFGMGQDRFFLDKLEFQLNTSSFVDYQRNLNLLKQLPSCFGYGYFDKIDADSKLWNEYMELKKQSKDKFLKKKELTLLSYEK